MSRMTIHERAVYLKNKGWIHNEDGAQGKRWYCPHDRQRYSIMSGYDTQRKIDSGELVPSKCLDCGAPVLVWAKLNHEEGYRCLQCKKSKYFNKMGAFTGKDAGGYSVNISKESHKRIKQISQETGRTIKRVIADLLTSALEAQ